MQVACEATDLQVEGNRRQLAQLELLVSMQGKAKHLALSARVRQAADATRPQCIVQLKRSYNSFY